MEKWWRNWTYEIPLAISDALWELCVVQFAAFLDRLTLRKAIEFFLIFMLALAFAQTFSIDLAFLFAGDTLMYLEFLVAIRLAAGRMYLKEVLSFAWRIAQITSAWLRAAVGHSATRLARWREPQHPPSAAKLRRKAQSSNEDPAFGGTWGFAAA